MTPTAVAKTFNKLMTLNNDDLLQYRALAFADWGRKGDEVSELIALQAEKVCRDRGL